MTTTNDQRLIDAACEHLARATDLDEAAWIVRDQAAHLRARYEAAEAADDHRRVVIEALWKAYSALADVARNAERDAEAARKHAETLFARAGKQGLS